MTPTSPSESTLRAARLVDRWAGEVVHLHAQGFIHGNLLAAAFDPEERPRGGDWLIFPASQAGRSQSSETTVPQFSGKNMPVPFAGREPLHPADGTSAATNGMSCLLGPGTLREQTPIPLRELGSIRLSREIGAAGRQLNRLGVPFDPRRIDLFQLGAVLCRLATGQSADGYLRSPTIKSKVPPELWPLLDRSLIDGSSSSFADVAEFRTELAPLLLQGGRE